MFRPRTLFLQHEQRFFWWDEPGHLEIYMPMVASGLLGEVRTYPFQRDVRWLTHLAAQPNEHSSDKASGNVEEGLYQNLIHVIDEFKPDLVVYLITWTSENIPIPVLERLKSTRDFKLMTLVPDYNEDHAGFMEYDRAIIALSDLTALADSSWRVDRIRQRQGLYADYTNTESVHFMPTVPDLDMFKPSRVKRYGVTIAGSSEGERIKVVAALEARGIKVNRVGGLMQTDRFVSHEEYARALSESRIVVNTQTHVSERIQLKGRVSQVLGCGSFLLEQTNRESVRFLSDIDAEFWTTIDELTEKIWYWLYNGRERERRAKAWHDWFVAKHNPVTWTKRILDHTF